MQSATLMGFRELYDIRKAQVLYNQQFAPNHKHLDESPSILGEGKNKTKNRAAVLHMH